MTWWQELATLKSATVAGAAGGLVRWLTLKTPMRDGLSAVVVGAITATYCTPAILPLLRPLLGMVTADEAGRDSLAGFLIGLIGVAFTGFMLDWWADRRARLLRADRHEREGRK